jgi:hypothetical protein
MRDRLVMPEPFIGLGDSLALGVTQGVSIFLIVDHHLEQPDHGRELVGAQFIEQAMGVLPVGCHCASPVRFRKSLVPILPCVLAAGVPVAS